MKKLPVIFIVIAVFFCEHTLAAIRLIASVTPGAPAVNLRWNMVNYPGNTAYTLFKSEDGVIWTVAAANPVFRKYTASTILAYTDNFSNEERLYYRVKVYDMNENIVEISNTTLVENPVTNYRKQTAPVHRESSPGEQFIGNNSHAWRIFPNPVRDMLNLTYMGSERIRGVINITIQDATGKIVIRFRAASNQKQLHIPVSNLHAGVYFIKLNVINEMQMNERFVKQ